MNGPNAHPLFVELKQAIAGADGTASIKGNFAKFLISREGRVLARCEPKTTPDPLIGDIEGALD